MCGLCCVISVFVPNVFRIYPSFIWFSSGFVVQTQFIIYSGRWVSINIWVILIQKRSRKWTIIFLIRPFPKSLNGDCDTVACRGLEMSAANTFKLFDLMPPALFIPPIVVFQCIFPIKCPLSVKVLGICPVRQPRPTPPLHATAVTREHNMHLKVDDLHQDSKVCCMVTLADYISPGQILSLEVQIRLVVAPCGSDLRMWAQLATLGVPDDFAGKDLKKKKSRSQQKGCNSDNKYVSYCELFIFFPSLLSPHSL